MNRIERIIWRRPHLTLPALGAIACVALVGAMVAIKVVKCDALGDTMGLPSDYTLPNGCFIQDGGKWFPAGTYRHVP